jgi:CRP-like cAMP-binding protein
MYRDDVFEKELRDGDTFGEHAIINDALRSRTVVAVTHVAIWGLERQLF